MHTLQREAVGVVWDRDTLRARLVDTNDGIVATAGIVEGFYGAGANLPTVLAAALAAMVAGGVSLGAAKYAEAAGERDAELATIAAERERITRAPEEELAELTEIYESKGLSPRLARQVAEELSARDPLAAHLEAEYHLDPDAASPEATGVSAGIAFALGSGIPLLTAVFVNPTNRVAVTFVVVLLALSATSVIAARTGRLSTWRVVARTAIIGALTMLVTFGGGHLIDL